MHRYLKAVAETVKAMFLGMRRPGPYLAFDISVLAAEFLLFERLVRDYENFWIETYIFAYAFFLVGIWLKRYDARYLAGLRVVRSGGSLLAFWLPFSVYFLGIVPSGFAIGGAYTVAGWEGAAPAFPGIPLIFLCLLGYPLVFYIAVWRRSAPERPLPPDTGAGPFLLRFVSSLGLYGLSLYMLTFVHNQIGKMDREMFAWYFSPLVIFAIAFFFLCFYVPGRIHLLVDRPHDRANAGWMALTALSMAAAAFWR
jgi:hypothetical protein